MASKKGHILEGIGTRVALKKGHILEGIGTRVAVAGEADTKICQPHLSQQWSNLRYTGPIYPIYRYGCLQNCLLVFN